MGNMITAHTWICTKTD